ncbi:Flp family type IVb pilin [Cupriavidus basilensis]|uniref:Flp family type IVb pilin n=1 Tax=Cupriavidus basilensis TaxID=68895 RepID=UPI0020A69ED5|nr:Flp family type IVb pilin [Cupriavidus basilensis]MCP3021615.1 Flp family type IVb pilin [Cupriavidus basilensis]
MKNALARFLRDEQGATAIEYGLIAGLISLAIVGTATTLGTEIGGMLGRLTTQVKNILPASSSGSGG